MHLIEIKSAKYIEPAPTTTIECIIVAEIDGVIEEFTFVSIADDWYGLSPDVAAWFLSNPDFEIEPYVEPPAPEPIDPNTIELPRREFRRALLHFGMDTATVVGVINTITDPVEREEMMIWWEDTQKFERHYPVLLAMIDAAGVTEAQADVIWAYGVGLLDAG